MTNVKNIEAFLLREVVAEQGRKQLDPEEDLLEQGVVDSLGLMKLIVFLEDTFKLRIDDEEVVPENFQSLSSMAAFVEQKIQGR